MKRLVRPHSVLWLTALALGQMSVASLALGNEGKPICMKEMKKNQDATLWDSGSDSVLYVPQYKCIYKEGSETYEMTPEKMMMLPEGNLFTVTNNGIFCKNMLTKGGGIAAVTKVADQALDTRAMITVIKNFSFNPEDSGMRSRVKAIREELKQVCDMAFETATAKALNDNGSETVFNSELFKSLAKITDTDIVEQSVAAPREQFATQTSYRLARNLPEETAPASKKPAAGVQIVATSAEETDSAVPLVLNNPGAPTAATPAENQVETPLVDTTPASQSDSQTDNLPTNENL